MQYCSELQKYKTESRWRKCFQLSYKQGSVIATNKLKEVAGKLYTAQPKSTGRYLRRSAILLAEAKAPALRPKGWSAWVEGAALPAGGACAGTCLGCTHRKGGICCRWKFLMSGAGDENNMSI